MFSFALCDLDNDKNDDDENTDQSNAFMGILQLEAAPEFFVRSGSALAQVKFNGP